MDKNVNKLPILNIKRGACDSKIIPSTIKDPSISGLLRVRSGTTANRPGLTMACMAAATTTSCADPEPLILRLTTNTDTSADNRNMYECLRVVFAGCDDTPFPDADTLNDSEIRVAVDAAVVCTGYRVKSIRTYTRHWSYDMITQLLDDYASLKYSIAWVFLDEYQHSLCDGLLHASDSNTEALLSELAARVQHHGGTLVVSDVV